MMPVESASSRLAESKCDSGEGTLYSSATMHLPGGGSLAAGERAGSTRRCRQNFGRFAGYGACSDGWRTWNVMLADWHRTWPVLSTTWKAREWVPRSTGLILKELPEATPGSC